MDRRDFLHRATLAGSLAALAGCTSERLQEAERRPDPFEWIPAEEFDLPVQQRLSVAAAGIEEAATVEIGTVEELGTYLRAQGIDVEALAATGSDVSLEYVDDEHVERGLFHDLGIVCGGYVALRSAGHGSEKLVAHVLDGDRAYGEYEIRREWADAYAAGDLTAREYADEVAVTVESV